MRMTWLAIDEEGRTYIASEGYGDMIHTEEDLVRLFVEENKKYGKCEVKKYETSRC